MIYRDFNGMEISLLGMGAMRLPVIDGSDASVDEAKACEIFDYLHENGVNYFDTAYSYHLGASEPFVGKTLARYPRESFYIASKMPGHEIRPTFDPSAIFEEQLGRCKVDRFDFYLMHNVYEHSIMRYMDETCGILPYLIAQKKAGRIRNLGFSTHARLDTLERFLDFCGEDVDFVQLQLNYVDWELQDARAKYEMVTERGLPVVVMEPQRGGRLLAIGEQEKARLQACNPAVSLASWGFRWIESLPEVFTVLSGMTTLEQAQDNIATFASYNPLSDKERVLLEGLVESMATMQPCTSCRYCCGACPQGLDIPTLIRIRDDCAFGASMSVSMAIDAMPENKRPQACLDCGACARVCPQNIAIPHLLSELASMAGKLPHWADISAQRREIG